MIWIVLTFLARGLRPLAFINSANWTHPPTPCPGGHGRCVCLIRAEGQFLCKGQVRSDPSRSLSCSCCRASQKVRNGPIAQPAIREKMSAGSMVPEWICQSGRFSLTNLLSTM